MFDSQYMPIGECAARKAMAEHPDGEALVARAIEIEQDMNSKKSHIDRIDFDTQRTYHALREIGISEIEELTRLTERDLLRAKHVGKRTVDELRGVLAERGLSFREPSDPLPMPELSVVSEDFARGFAERIFRYLRPMLATDTRHVAAELRREMSSLSAAFRKAGFTIEYLPEDRGHTTQVAREI